MKRKLVVSWLTIAALVATMLGTASVGAASYTIGVKQDFEQALNTGNEMITQVHDERYGGTLRFASTTERVDCDFPLEFGQTVSSGKYLMSFDAKMPSVSPDTRLLIWTNNAANEFTRYLVLTGGRLCTIQGDTFTPIVGTEYAENVWQRYDLSLDFDTKTAKVYADGRFCADINLADLNVTGMNKIYFNYVDETKSGAAVQIDNVYFRQLTETAAMTAEYTYKGQFEVHFSETVTDVEAGDFTLTRTMNGENAETVPFTVDYITADKAVLTPASVDGGYSYQLTFADKKTVFGHTVENRDYTYVSQQQVIDFTYKPENAPWNYTYADDETYRGRYLKKSNASGDGAFDIGLPQTLTGGKYLFSYDFKFNNNNNSRVIIVSLNGGWSQGTWENNKFGEVLKGDWRLNAYGNTIITNGQWYRVDNVMDLDTKKMYTYLDGIYMAQTDISNRIDENGWKSIGINSTGPIGDAEASFDNISVKSIGGGYDAAVTAAGNLVTIDFSETTYVAKDNFAVRITDNPFSAEEVADASASLVYQNGTKAVLQLDTPITSGQKCVVTCNGVKSFLGKTQEQNVFVGTGTAEQVIAVADDTMSDYSGTLHGTGPWKSTEDANKGENLTAENAVLYKAENENRVAVRGGGDSLYIFEKPVKKGVLSVDLSVTKSAWNRSGYWLKLMGKRGEEDVSFCFACLWYNRVALTSTWQHETSLVENQEVTVPINVKFDFDRGKMTVTYGDTSASVYKSSEELSLNEVTSITGIRLHPLEGYPGKPLYINSIKAENRYMPNVIGAVGFTDVFGYTDYSLTGHKSTVKSLDITFPDGLQNNSMDGLVSVDNGEFTDYTTSYDADTKTGKIIFNTVAGANRTYNVAITGAKTAAGADYEPMTGSFTTGNAVSEVSNLALEQSGSNVSVSADFVNTTGAEKNYVIVCAAYDGSALAWFDYEPVTVVSNDTEVRKTHTFTGMDGAYTKVSAFVWESFENMRPVIQSVSK